MKIMRIFFSTIFLILLVVGSFAQIIEFQDEGIKSFLIHEMTMASTEPFDMVDFNIDLNNDQEISVEEALAVNNLHIGAYNHPFYEVTSLKDLSHFENLEILSISVGNTFGDMISFTGLTLDSLTHLSIVDSGPMDSIDVSTMPGLTSIAIIGLSSLDYLNIQNGSAAYPFTLFYTQNISYACVDSIANEYNEVAIAMAFGSGGPSVVCDVTSISEFDNSFEFNYYPNPTSGLLQWSSDISIDIISIYDNLGRLVSSHSGQYSEVDISHLDHGRYTAVMTAGNRQSFTSILKN